MPARESAQRWLQSIWYGQARAPLALRALSGLYGAAMQVRAAAYRARWLRSHGSGRPLIVVGNLTVGGSGKTPLVVWICEQLRDLGARPGVVLRGYGGSAAASGVPQAVNAHSDPRVVGDEALLLARRTGVPVVVGHDRVAAARAVVRAGTDVVVSDDGLQHLRLARDLEVVVIDAARGFGNGRLLPAGPLRQPTSRLCSVQALVLNGDATLATWSIPEIATTPGPACFQMQMNGERLVSLGDERSVPLVQFSGRRVHAVAGIGHPERFFRQLTSAGLQVVEHAFADHHAFRREELVFSDGLPLLMTEKDAVKCQRLGLPGAWFLPVSAHFPPAQVGQLREMLRATLMR